MAAPKVRIVSDWNPSGVKAAQRDLGMMERQAQGFSSAITKSFTGIGAALGGMFAATAVIDFLKDSAQAAMEDEKSMVALAKAMDNVGLASKNAEAEGLIKSMSLQVGIADDELRPAYQKLVTVTKDVTEAQGLLQTALDLSAAGYGELTATSKALSAAANGNFTALQRLKVPIDQAALASKDFDAAVESLNKTVGGQAAAAAGTYAGQVSRITVAVGEAQEAIGYALLQSLERATKSLGGTGGLVGAIDDATTKFTEFVDYANQANDSIESLIRSMPGAKKDADLLSVGFDTMKRQLLLMLGPLGNVVNLLERFGAFEWLGRVLGEVQAKNQAATVAARGYTSATVAAALAAGNASGAIAILGDETDAASSKAWDGAQSYLAFAESVVAARRAASDLANTSGTVQSAIAQGASMGGVPAYWEQLRQKYGEVEKAARSAGGSGSKAAEDLAVKWRQAAAQINADLDGLKVSFGGGGTVIAGGMVDAFQSRMDAFRSIITEQTQIIGQARAALDDYAKSVTDTILGNVKFSMTGAEGEPLSPEQVVQMVLGDIEQQGKAVQAISQIATKIPEALAQQILTLPPDAAIGLANYLAANPAQLEQLTTNYNALALTTQTLLGVPMGEAFAMVGDQSATAMIESAKAKIKDSADDFKTWVQSKLKTRITVEVEYRAINVVSGASLQARADGGPVTRDTPFMVGERGPEVFVPNQAGVIIPNDALTFGGSPVGGNTYQITVQAGVGDPRAIGKSVVEAITLFERSSGPVFARA